MFDCALSVKNYSNILIFYIFFGSMGMEPIGGNALESG
jgi:hypothetical protein